MPISTNTFKIRLITLEDAASTLEVYRPYIENTTITFEYEVPSLMEWETRIKTQTADYPWLVCEYRDEIVGYAYGGRHRYRTAYSWSVESAIYLSEKFHRLGLAKILYETLFAILKLQGYANVYAGVVVPNVKSEDFHLALGFQEIGSFKKIGFKFGAWHDTRWFQLHLIDHPADPAKPTTMDDIQNNSDLITILENGNVKLSERRF